MKPSDFALLLEDVEAQILKGATSIGILGLSGVTLQLVAALAVKGVLSTVRTIYADGFPMSAAVESISVRPISEMQEQRHDVVVVAADAEKEALLDAALPHVLGSPKVIVSGYGHLRFRDPIFEEELSHLLVPSLANGYPNTLTHLYQCLCNASRLNLDGVIVEFGMFKGGTTMFLSRLVERLGKTWRVIGFDTFDGFPPRRSILDMYDHPDCVFRDLPVVKRYLSGRNVEIVPGDIVETCPRLQNENVVLTFMDTDNYTPCRAALDVVRERTLIGGAIVFDHFTGVDRFRYTLGERMAGKSLLDDRRYFHLHDTGVFFRQC